MELQTNLESVLCHYKDNQLVAITHQNGRPMLMETKEMDNKAREEFYEVNKAKQV